MRIENSTPLFGLRRHGGRLVFTQSHPRLVNGTAISFLLLGMKLRAGLQGFCSRLPGGLLLGRYQSLCNWGLRRGRPGRFIFCSGWQRLRRRPGNGGQWLTIQGSQEIAGRNCRSNALPLRNALIVKVVAGLTSLEQLISDDRLDTFFVDWPMPIFLQFLLVLRDFGRLALSERKVIEHVGKYGFHFGLHRLLLVAIALRLVKLGSLQAMSPMRPPAGGERREKHHD